MAGPGGVTAGNGGVQEPSVTGDLAGAFQLSFKRESGRYAFTSEIDPAILEFDPELADQLWRETKQALESFARQADEAAVAADSLAAETGGSPWFTLFTFDVSYKAGPVLEDVIAVRKTVSSFTGGAHPNLFLSGFNYRKGENIPLQLSTFIADEPAFHALVIKDLFGQRLERGFEAFDIASVEAGQSETLVPTEEIEDAYSGRFVLEASTDTGKLGGISVLFSPYAVGAYAEGAYTVTLTAEELIPILAETWAGRFSGEPLIK